MRDAFVFQKVVFMKLFSKLFSIYLLLEKLINEKYFSVNGKYFLVNRKHFSIKENFGLIFKKVFSFYFGQKTLSRSCEKFRNIMLFADYVKFGP